MNVYSSTHQVTESTPQHVIQLPNDHHSELRIFNWVAFYSSIILSIITLMGYLEMTDYYLKVFIPNHSWKYKSSFIPSSDVFFVKYIVLKKTHVVFIDYDLSNDKYRNTWTRDWQITESSWLIHSESILPYIQPNHDDLLKFFILNIYIYIPMYRKHFAVLLSDFVSVSSF